jgi:hypothetical protein
MKALTRLNKEEIDERINEIARDDEIIRKTRSTRDARARGG